MKPRSARLAGNSQACSGRGPPHHGHGELRPGPPTRSAQAHTGAHAQHARSRRGIPDHRGAPATAWGPASAPIQLHALAPPSLPPPAPHMAHPAGAPASEWRRCCAARIGGSGRGVVGAQACDAVQDRCPGWQRWQRRGEDVSEWHSAPCLRGSPQARLPQQASRPASDHSRTLSHTTHGVRAEPGSSGRPSLQTRQASPGPNSGQAAEGRPQSLCKPACTPPSAYTRMLTTFLII